MVVLRHCKATTSKSVVLNLGGALWSSVSVEQQQRHVCSAVVSGDVQRSQLVLALSVRVGALVQQQPSYFELAELRRHVQRRKPTLCTPIN